MRVHITLKPEALLAATSALVARGITPREHFDGPIFEEANGVEVTGDFVWVELGEDTGYAYPVSDVARIKYDDRTGR